MRRDLVAEVLEAASDELFEDVLYTHPPAGAVTLTSAIFGVEPASERFENFGAQVRQGTHVTRALKAKFPALAKGDTINDGIDSYTVLDFEPVCDGRFEVLISLQKA